MNPFTHPSLRPLWVVAGALLFLTAALVATPSPAFAQDVFVVDDDGFGAPGDCDADIPADKVIQDAIDDAAAGDTILVCPGVYDEQVAITKNNLTLRGEDRATTILSPQVVAFSSNRPSNELPVAPIVLVDGVSGVTVSNLTVDGSPSSSTPSILPCGVTPFYSGIYYRLASGTIDNTRVENIRSGDTCNFAIMAQGLQTVDGPRVALVISNNSLQGYSEAGIGCIGQNVTCTITGNALKGDGPVAGYFQAGIVLRAEAAGVIAGNTLTDHFREGGLGMPNWSAAIFLVYADPGTIHHLKTVNTFANNQVDVQYLGSAAAWD